ncbi:MAG: S8 family serine peptidase [Thermodesulfovibrionales bacterium]|nr:S8 family serine peptidase [Thermodesulfovibrionales bacterium]
MIARVLFSFLAAIFFAAYAPDSLHAGQEKAPASVIKKISAGESQNILILFDDSAIESETSLMRGLYGVMDDTQDMLDLKARRYKGIKERVLKSIPKREFEIIKDYSHLPLIFLKAISSTALSRLLGRNEVARVYEDQAYTHFLVQSLPLMNQPQVASSMIVGTGTTVAVLDTGVDYTLTAFGNCTAPGVPAGCKVSFAQDFAPNDYSLDNNGHGTNVAGIVLGVAPGTKIAALDVFRSNGYAYSSDIISAINWCIANKSSYNVVAMNLSLGGGSYTQPCPGDIFSNPIANARAAGILSAIASGNNGYVNRLSSPACVPSAVSVGAVYDANIGSKYWTICYDTTTAADRVACFSNSASFLTLLAPGSVITAAGIAMSGTSQATPHIAGSIAVLKGEGAFPEATPDEIVSRMTGTGIPVTDWRNGIAKPRIDLFAAIGTQTPPVANFAGSPASGTAPVNVNFTDISTGSPTVWLWDFGDGGASNLQNPSHEYNAAGTYTVSLTVTNANGSDTETKTGYITVSDPGQFATITVTTPNGGERWSLFSYQAIRWTYSGNPGSTVRIELYKSGVLNRVLSSGRLTNTGSYFWFVPYTITPGSDYRIKITSTSNPSYNDTSDANFTIVRGF